MNAADSVAQFHEGGATQPGILAVYDLNARALDALVPQGGRLLDLGVGSGRALGRFLTMRPDVRAVGVDLADNMLAQARTFLDAEGVGDRVDLIQADLTALPEALCEQSWDTISAVWTLHHMPDGKGLRATLSKIAELRARDASTVWLLDFQRMRGADTFRKVLDVMGPQMPPVLRTDALASEAAALSHTELRDELAAAGLDGLRSGVSRPIPYMQAFWSDPALTSRHERARPLPLRGAARGDALMLRRGFSQLPE